MTLKGNSFKAVWDSDSDNIVSEFLIPALSSATLYQRVAGFFNSSTLAVAARGIKNLLENGGKMQLICGCELTQQDKDAMEKGETATEFNAKFLAELNALEDGDFRKNHAQILGWMIKNGKLEIKIAEVAGPGIYHMKVGIIRDDDHVVTFTGSNNESANGWMKSTETFDAFVSWRDGDLAHIEGHERIFGKFWNDQGNKTRVFSLPDAISKELIKIAPEDYHDIELHEESIKRKSFTPYDHQTKALEKWRENGFRGIFDIATGGGKTLTAILCAELAPKYVITIITVPKKLLQDQWIDEINEHAPNSTIIKIGGNNPNQDWEESIHNLLISYGNDTRKQAIIRRTFIVITDASAALAKFLNLWEKCDSSNVQLICDEVHNLGATGAQQIFTIPCERRIGLSATYLRQYDREGTQRLEDFFGGQPVFTYTIGEAIADDHLSHYEVHNHFFEFTEREWDEYHTLTRQIGQTVATYHTAINNHNSALAQASSAKQKKLSEERAEIIKSAENKINTLNEILPLITPNEKTIVFCADTNQLEESSSVLLRNSKTIRKYSTTLGLSDETLDQHIQEFNGDDAKFLVGINCLNEGLDIRTCTTCILMSSSGTKREFIQRRGRILRLGGLTDKAHIYDLIALPPSGITPNDDNFKTIQALLKHEVKRSDVVCEAADNRADIENNLDQEFTRLGLSLKDIRDAITNDEVNNAT